MAISRDEAREIAVVVLLATAGLRVGAGVVQAIEELTGAWTVGSVLDRLFAPVGSTLGFATLGAVLIVVLSPNGSITPGVATACRRAAGILAAIGMAAAVHTLLFGFASSLTRVWFAMINGLAAATLTGGAYWIIRGFDPRR